VTMPFIPGASGFDPQRAKELLGELFRMFAGSGQQQPMGISAAGAGAPPGSGGPQIPLGAGFAGAMGSMMGGPPAGAMGSMMRGLPAGAMDSMMGGPPAGAPPAARKPWPRPDPGGNPTLPR
jgi:hypothetical protein